MNINRRQFLQATAAAATVAAVPKLGAAPSEVVEPRIRVVTSLGSRGMSDIAHKAVIEKAVSESNKYICIIAPTYRQAKIIMWSRLCRDLGHRNVADEFMHTQMEIKLKNGSRVLLRGAEEPHSMQGYHLNHVVFLESHKIDPYVWDVVVMPSLATTQGTADITGDSRYTFDNHLLGASRKIAKTENPHFGLIEL